MKIKWKIKTLPGPKHTNVFPNIVKKCKPVSVWVRHQTPHVKQGTGRVLVPC